MAPLPAPDYSLVHHWALNIAEVQQAWDSDWVKAKIVSHLVRTEGQHSEARVQEIAKKIQNDRDMAVFFCKNPTRQSQHQKIFGAWLTSLGSPLIENLQALPSGGPQSLHVFGGKIFPFSQRPEGANAKSIDFTWRTAGVDIYVSHKYTGVEGGAQDNQYHDVQRFLQEASKNTQKRQRFLAVCDGPYYTHRAPENRDLTRLAYLQAMCTPNSMAITSHDLVPFLRSLLPPQTAP